jgi:hypothetical protein
LSHHQNAIKYNTTTTHQNTNTKTSYHIISKSMAPTKQYLETELDNDHSLPNIEEARTHHIIASGGNSNALSKNQYSGKSKRTIALIFIVVAVIATAVGFTIATTQNHHKSSSNSLSSNNEQDGVNDDGNTNNNDDMETDDDERLVQTNTFLIDNHISTSDSLKDTSSPQFKAANWIANVDDQSFDIPETTDEDDAYLFIQRYIVVVMYYALTGESWTRQLHFLSDWDTCDWNFNLQLQEPPTGSDQVDYDYGISCYDDATETYLDSVTYIFMRTFLFLLLLLLLLLWLGLWWFLLCYFIWFETTSTATATVFLPILFLFLLFLVFMVPIQYRTNTYTNAKYTYQHILQPIIT